MQFKVPQFLEIEDKIFGPFTFKEFVYLVGGAGTCYIIYKLLGPALGALPIIIVGLLSGLLTFYHPNGKPFIDVLGSSIKFASQDKLYIWKKEQFKKTEIPVVEEKTLLQKEEEQSHKFTPGKLRDLAWSLDVLDIKKENKK